MRHPRSQEPAGLKGAAKAFKAHDQRKSLKCPTDSSTRLFRYCLPNRREAVASVAPQALLE